METLYSASSGPKNYIVGSLRSSFHRYNTKSNYESIVLAIDEGWGLPIKPKAYGLNLHRLLNPMPPELRFINHPAAGKFNSSLDSVKRSLCLVSLLRWILLLTLKSARNGAGDEQDRRNIREVVIWIGTQGFGSIYICVTWDGVDRQRKGWGANSGRWVAVV